MDLRAGIRRWRISGQVVAKSVAVGRERKCDQCADQAEEVVYREGSEPEGAAIPVHDSGFRYEKGNVDISGKYVGRGDEVSLGVCEGNCEALSR